MKLELPRIKSVSVAGPAKLKVAWRNAAKADTIDLTGWIATGGGVLSALFDPQTFRQASVTNYGAAIDWNDADLAIDAAHLRLIAEEQRPFSGSDAEKWQRRVEISNNEVADLLGISLSTWNDYKARKQALLPAAVAMICRAVLRDPPFDAGAFQAALCRSAEKGRFCAQAHPQDGPGTETCFVDRTCERR